MMLDVYRCHRTDKLKNHTGTREIEKPVSIALDISVLRKQRYVLSPALARISHYTVLLSS